MKKILIQATHKFVSRLFIFGKASVVDLLLKNGSKVILVVTEEIKAVVLDYYKTVPENLTIEIMQENDRFKKLNLFQNIFLFLCNYQIFSGSTKIASSFGTRIDKKVAGGRRNLYIFKLYTYKLFKNQKWFKQNVLPFFYKILFRSEYYKAVLLKHKPDIVFLPNIAMIKTDQLFLSECMKQKIKTIGMPGSWDHFGRQYVPLKPGRLLVWGGQLKDEAMKMQGYSDDVVKVVGAPHFDQYVSQENIMPKKEFFQKIGFSKDTKLIFFGTGGSYYKDSYDIIDMMVKWIDEGVLGGSVALVIRPYPGVEHEQGKFEVFRNHPKVHFFEGNNWTTWKGFKFFINYLHYSDMIVSVYSSISLEGVAMNKPSININFDGHQEREENDSVKRFENLTHFGYLTKTDGVKNVGTAEEFKEEVLRLLKNPNRNKEARDVLRESMCHRLDGKASERIVDCVKLLLSN